MKTIIKYDLLISIILVIISLVGQVGYSERIFSPIIGSTGIFGIGFGIVSHHLTIRKSTRLLGIYILSFILIYIWRYFESYWGIESVLFFDTEYPLWTGRTIIIILITVYGVYQLRNRASLVLVLQTLTFKIFILFVLILILSELPIYGFHSDFGGNIHGHSYWDNNHIH